MNNDSSKPNNKSILKHRSFTFSKQLLKVVALLPNKKIYWVITDQLLRSGTSIGANIIEAQAARSKKDFIKFFQIALKSANETEYWLNLLKNLPEVNKQDIDNLINEVQELSKMLAASLITLKGKRLI